jgi:hypothetical protein
MPHLRPTVGANEQPAPAIAKAAPLGLLSTEAVVHGGAAEIRRSARALRHLADAAHKAAAHKAADLADEYDRDPEGFKRREEGRRV